MNDSPRQIAQSWALRLRKRIGAICHPITAMVVVYAALFCFHPVLAQFAPEGPKLVGSGAVGGAYQGLSVSLSADGNTAIVGGKIETWVCTRTGGIWVQQAKLADSGGRSASLSADGDTAIVGASAGGMVWSRSSGVWTRQTNLRIGSDAVGVPELEDIDNYRVSLSADGNTAIVAVRSDDNYIGAAWVWTRNGGVWAQQGLKLVGADVVNARYGSSVALSADGNTAIVGGVADDTHAGAVWVFTRTGGVWTQQGPKLVGLGAVGPYAEQGQSVSLSADGSTAIVGGWGDDSNVGAAWVWARTGGVWTQQGPKLVGSGAVGNAQQGAAVSISADGNTAIVGGNTDDSYAGGAWVWTRTAGVWTQQGPKLVGSGSAGNAFQGQSVSLSADGNTAVAGGPGDYNDGAAWVWTRSGGVWTQQGSKLVGSEAIGIAYQGASVGLSFDGNTAIVGGPLDNKSDGAAWVWTRSAGVWSQQGPKLFGSGAQATGYGIQQGSSVALSDDGNTAIVGGPASDAAWVWTRNAGVWNQQGPKLVGSDGVGRTTFGTGVALSADGNTAIVGGYGDDTYAGAVWVFTRTGGVWTQQGPKLVGFGAVACPLFPAAGGQGFSVSVSADGNTALVGGWVDNCNVGAAWVWTRSGGIWTQQGPKLVAADAGGNSPDQGYSVALSADGNTAIVGGPQDVQYVDGVATGTGAAYIWTRSGGVWTQQGTKLVASDAGKPAATGQGYSVSLSADGNTAVVGGGAWIWTRSGDLWTQQVAKLVGSGAVGSQDGIVSLSGDGNTAIVGSPRDNSDVGAAWVFFSPPTASFQYAPLEPIAGDPISFTNTSTGATSWSWNFGDGTTSESRHPPSHPYANPGTYVVTLTVRGIAKTSSSATKAVKVRTPVDAGVGLLLPVVIDSIGLGGSHYTTEVTVASRASRPVVVSMLYTGTVGGGTGYARITLAAGESRVIPQMIGFLRTNNLPLANDGSPKVGTLLLTVSGVTSGPTVYAGGRTYTPDPAGSDGTFGLSYAASTLTNDSVTIFGLQQGASQRSNLALVNGGSSTVTLRASLFGPNGENLGALPDQLLGPYGWYQFNTPLAGKATSGRAVVTRLSGSSPFTAYGVLNDAVTSDGSFIPALLPGDSTGGTRLVPIVLDVQGLTGRFRSEMTLTNFTSTALPITLDYTAAPLLNAMGSGRVPLTLNANEQRVIPDMMGYLRASGLTIPADGSGVGGSLLIRPPAGVAAGDLAAGVRTFSPAASGGSFGLFYPGLTLGESAESTAYLYGLQQNTAQRSNVAIVNRGDAGGAITLRITYYSGAGDILAPSDDRTLASGEWFQYSKPLEARGASSGYAKIERLSGASRFAAYAILNDQVNGDGSYVAMSH